MHVLELPIDSKHYESLWNVVTGEIRFPLDIVLMKKIGFQKWKISDWQTRLWLLHSWYNFEFLNPRRV